MPSKQRAALYHRVSTVDQDPAAARKELRAAAKRHGFRLALDIEETGSGASNSRPGLTKLMQAAGRGRIDVVLVWKLDRFGRSALDLLANLRALEDAGVRFISITQGIDLRPNGDAMSRLMLTMLGAVAEFERALISERTRLGMAKARADGKPIGRPRSPRPSAAQVRRFRKRGVWGSKHIRTECCAKELYAKCSSSAPANPLKSRSGGSPGARGEHAGAASCPTAPRALGCGQGLAKDWAAAKSYAQSGPPRCHISKRYIPWALTWPYRIGEMCPSRSSGSGSPGFDVASVC